MWWAENVNSHMMQEIPEPNGNEGELEYQVQGLGGWEEE